MQRRQASAERASPYSYEYYEHCRTHQAAVKNELTRTVFGRRELYAHTHGREKKSGGDHQHRRRYALLFLFSYPIKQHRIYTLKATPAGYAGLSGTSECQATPLPDLEYDSTGRHLSGFWSRMRLRMQ